MRLTPGGGLSTGQAAIEAYHALLTDELAGESQRQLDDQLRARGLYFGDRPLCSVLRPRFFSPRQYHFLQERAAAVLSAFRRAHRVALDDNTVLEQFRPTGWEVDLARIDHGFSVASPVSRLDAFFIDGGAGLSFTEYNAETPAGGAYNDALVDVFYGMPVMRRFLCDWDMRPIPARYHVLQALLDAYEEWSGTHNRPRIAIVDWNDVPTRSEFTLFQQYFFSQGYACEIVDPRDVTYSSGTLSGPAGVIDLIYKRVLLTELVEREGIESPIIRAVRDRAVCMVNPPACKLLHKKASLAVLHDERNADMFSHDERRAILASIPWTRVVEQRSTNDPAGKTVDLIEYTAANRDHLVLKPNDEYGGKGIVLGWEVDDAAWSAALKAAIAEPYIVQDRIALPKEPYPSMVDGKVVFADRMVDTAPYVAYGAYVDGCLTRLASAALLNVTAGGGSQTPTFLVERR